MNDAPGRPPGMTPPQPRRPSAESEAASFAGAGGNAGLLTEGGGLYRLLVQSVGDYAIFALDTTGHILSWNEGAQRIKGYRPEEIIGKHFSIFYPQEEIDAGKPPMELDVATKVGRYEEEGWRLRKDGTRFWANVVITALRDKTGGLVGFAKVTRDLTERRRSENALRASEERFRLLVDSVKDYGIFVLDPTGHITSWNEGAQRIKGYLPEEIIGKHFSIFYPQEDIDAGKPPMELEVATKVGRYEEEGWRLRKDGTRFWANIIITPLHNEAGTLIGFAKVTRDLTERRAAEELRMIDMQRVAQAEAANRLKTDFLAAMSHELRTPLNAIGGYAELLELGIHGPVTPQQRTALDRIQQSQRHLLGIITDLLNFSRIEAGQVAYDRAPVAIDEVVGTVLPLLEPQAAAKALTLKHESCAPGLVATADRLKAEQILLNLLSNAVKFTPNGGRISVQCAGTAEAVTITVRDTGLGVPLDQQTAIFEPFVQLGRTRSSAHEGTGLGLAISRDLARAMGGDIAVESDGKEGSAFTLTLPRS